MALLLPLHHTPNPGSTRRTGSDLPILRLRATTVPPRAGRSSPEPPTPEPSFHEKGRGRREPVGNTRPRPWLDVDEGVRRLARAIAAAAAATAMLCLAPRVAAEASVGEGRGGFHPLPCADVAGYYSGLDGLEGAALMRRLGAIVSVHRSLAYKEVWDALKILDAADPIDPEHSSEVIDIYSLRAVPKSLAGKPQGWNREHLWPRSYGLMDKPSLTDLHNLRPADVNVNSSRGNKYFGECFPESNECLRPANTEAAPDTETDSKRWAPPLQFVEIVADSSLEANSLWLLLYNGSTGKVYKSLLLGDSQAFTVSNSISRFLIYTAFLPLQNGPDGIALALVGDDDQSKVIQFLSYEGTFKAIDGPARGKESVDVNVQETLTSSEHDSLGLTGTTRGEFVWKKFEGAATPGKSNVGQRL